MDFYLSRGVEGRGGYMLSAYPPKRDPSYDAFKRNDGSVVGQMDIGSWFFWPRSDEPSFSRSLNEVEVHSLRAGRTVGYGVCVNLSTGDTFTLADAEDYREKKTSAAPSNATGTT